MTHIEKLTLMNQYEILKRLDPKQAEDCDLLIGCLLNGYEKDFDQLLPYFDEPLTEPVYREVREILEMFRALGPSWATGEFIPAVARFVGFDGNEETAHYAYARFLIEDRGLWRESKINDYNTHYPVLSRYQNMLSEWRKSENIHQLAPTDVTRILQHAPDGSTGRGDVDADE